MKNQRNWYKVPEINLTLVELELGIAAQSTSSNQRNDDYESFLEENEALKENEPSYLIEL